MGVATDTSTQAIPPGMTVWAPVGIVAPSTCLLSGVTLSPAESTARLPATMFVATTLKLSPIRDTRLSWSLSMPGIPYQLRGAGARSVTPTANSSKPPRVSS